MTGSSECPCRGLIPNCPLCGGFGKLACTVCGGTRFIATLVSEGVYKTDPCPACGDEPQRSMVLAPGIPDGAREWTFDNLRLDYKELQEAARAIREILDKGRGWFVLHTPPGRGKTFLLCAAVHYALKKGQSATYIEAAGMLQALQDATLGSHPTLTHAALQRGLIEADLLTIDEFGVQSDSEFRLTELRMVLDARSDKGGWKPTGFATNETAGQLAQRFPWLFSRFQAAECLEITLAHVPNLRAQHEPQTRFVL